MGLFSNLFNKNREKKEILQTKVVSKQEEDEDEITAVIAAVLSSMDEEETVAAITAAISLMLGTSTSNFVVRNIKRTPELDSIWSLAGRMKLMR